MIVMRVTSDHDEQADAEEEQDEGQGNEVL